MPSYWLFSPIIFDPFFPHHRPRVPFSVHYHRDNSSVSRTIWAYGVLANHGGISAWTLFMTSSHSSSPREETTKPRQDGRLEEQIIYGCGQGRCFSRWYLCSDEFHCSALKLRYLLPLIVPSTPNRPDQMPSPSSPARTASSPARTPTRIRFATNEPPLNFDPRLVARREEEWESMLEATLLRWVAAVVEER